MTRAPIFVRALVRRLALAWLSVLAACSSREEPVEPPASLPLAPPVPVTPDRPKAEPSPVAAPPPNFDSEEELEELCRTFSKLSLPPGDQPSSAERKQLAKCDTEAAYYGIGARPDYVAARKCAYAELERGAVDGLFQGPNILMMLYANGRGTPTNFDLSLKFACTRKAEPAERRLAVETLWKARAGAGLTKVLDVCDFQPEGPTLACVKRDSRIAAVKRDARKHKATLGLRSRELTFLEKIARDFFEARVRYELGARPDWPTTLEVQERDRLADEYVDLLEKLADQRFSPSGSEGSEARLAAFHSRLLACKELGSKTARQLGLSPRGLADAQRAWTKYRDAWLALVAKARPKSELSAWRSLLAEQRLRALETLPLCQKP
jgi:hypothetical protein